MYKILIYLEKDHLADCLDLVNAALKISKARKDFEIYGAGINLDEKLSYANLDYVINAKGHIEAFDVPSIALVLEKIYQEYKFDCILVCATTFGRMLAPRLAMKLGTGLVADVTELQCDETGVMMVRPAFTGQIMAGIVSDAMPVMMSVRPKVFQDDGSYMGVATYTEFNLGASPESGIRHIATEWKADSNDIRDSKLLVSCGGGMGGDLDIAKVLADKLGGKLAVSRRPVDAGLANRQIQVGQSGKIVSPKVYMAFGISGSMQHIDGIKNAASIISINTDKNAPLNHLADIVVVGDGHQFAKNLLSRIEKN